MMSRLWIALAVGLGVSIAAPAASGPARTTFPELAKRANAARKAGRLEEAAGLYKRAVALRPSWTEGWWYLGTLFYDKDRYPEGLHAFREFVRLDQRSGPAYALLGLCEYQTRQYAAALEHLERARALGIDNNPELSKVARYHTVALLIKAEQFEPAFQILTGLAQQGEESPMLVEAAGLCGLRKALLPPELSMDDRPLVLKAGRALYSAAQRRPQQAQQFFTELVEEYPNTPNVHYAYGSFLMLGDADAGIRELKRELEITPDHVPAMIGLVFEYLKRDDAGPAVEYARKAAGINPRSFVTHNALGRALLAAGDLHGAIQELESAVKIAPDSPQNRIALASAYSKAGRMADASRERSEFLRLRKQIEHPEEEQK